MTRVGLCVHLAAAARPRGARPELISRGENSECFILSGASKKFENQEILNKICVRLRYDREYEFQRNRVHRPSIILNLYCNEIELIYRKYVFVYSPLDPRVSVWILAALARDADRLESCQCPSDVVCVIIK